MARKVPILAKRTKGPPTPNFGKVSDLLETGTLTSIVFQRERVIDQHGGVGIKMSFVCDLLESIDMLQKHEAKAYCEGGDLYINADIFFGLLRNIDVYVFELYSILDYLAVELSEIFGLKVERRGQEKQVEYFMELQDAKNLGLGINKMVEALIRQPWFDYFHRLRNRVTHRTPVNFLGQAKFEGGKFVDFQYPFLPDNPEEVTMTFDKKLEVLGESKKWLESIFSFVDDVSRALLSLFKTPAS
jgi:hypothetical protein